MRPRKPKPPPPPPPPPPTPTPLSVRGIYTPLSGFDAAGLDKVAATRFTHTYSSPFAGELDGAAARGMKSFIWLGQYSNATCQFVYTDAQVQGWIAKIVDHPANSHIYQVTDEPDLALCPDAPAAVAARSAVIKAADPQATTFITAYKIPQFAAFAGKADMIWPDGYPCTTWGGCDYARIDAQAAKLDRLGVRYIACIQGHGDIGYIQPTPAQLHEQFVRWRATRMEGYAVFAWRWPTDDPPMWLENHQELLDQLVIENAS